VDEHPQPTRTTTFVNLELGERSMSDPTTTPAWKALTSRHAQIKDVHLRRLFADDPGPAERFSAEGAGLFLDYLKNRITDETLRRLLQLAEECGVSDDTPAFHRHHH
jgi:glucose-6-phosphate isomerase